MPVRFVLTLINWYNKLFSKVKWNNILSPEFQINCGIRQGGVISPTLFCIYVNDVLKCLDNYGCFINGISYGSFMYADDLVLLAPSVDQLQKMINIFCIELKSIGLELNANKSFFMSFGKSWGNCSAALKTTSGVIPRVLSGRYLGLDIISGPKLKINFYRQKCKFYSSFNAIYSKLGCYNSEMVSLHLAHTIALPCLLYGQEALKLTKTDLREIESPWNRVFMKVFKTFDLNIILEC